MNVKGIIRQDISASIVVFFVAVPLCLGIALASDAPALAGLIAGIIGGIVVGLISGSQLGVSGPAAGLAVIVASAIGDLGGFDVFLVAVALSGVFQIILGVARCGIIAHFFPSAVIKGMLAGIGVIIFLKQIPHAFGYDSDFEGDVFFMQKDGETTLSALGKIAENFELSAMIVCGISLMILFFWPMLTKRVKALSVISAPLLAVAFGIAFQWYTGEYKPDYLLTGRHVVNVPVAESFSEMGSLMQFPAWSALSNPKVYVAAITIAVVGSLETLLCVEATDKLDPDKRVTPTNRELVAQGVGNLCAGLIGGLPITQVIIRSSANIQSGGKTKLSAIFHGVFMLVFVLLFPQVLNMIPKAALAAILLLVGYRLARPGLFIDMWKRGWTQFLPFVVTVVCIYQIDLLSGIALGLAIAVFNILRSSYQNSHFLHVEKNETPNTVRMRLAEEVTFLNRGAIIHELAEVPDGMTVIIDKSESFFVDPDVMEVIEEFHESAKGRNIKFELIERKATAAQ